MRKLLLVAFVLLLATPAAAGDMLQWGIYGGAEAGALFFDLRKLNDYLDDARVDDFPSVVPTVGFNLQGVLAERIHVGCAGAMFMTYQPGLAADVHFAGASTDFFIGYDILATPTWRLRPEFGVGGALLMLRVDGLVQTLPEVEAPLGADNLDFAKTAVLGKAGVTAEWTPKLLQSANGMLGLTVSVSAGLYAPLTDKGWEITSEIDDKRQDIDGDGPDIQFLAGYASLGVRFGGGITEVDP